jgi:hypothetical protein
VNRTASGGHLDRRGAVADGEPVLAAEPGNVADIAGHGGGDDGTGAEDLGEGGAGCPDRRSQLLLGAAELGV